MSAGADAGPDVLDDRAGLVADAEVVGAVEAVHLQAAEPGDQLGHRSRVLVGARHRDGEAVVGHHVQHGEVEVAGGVEALPELALAARALAEAHVGELVAMRVQAELRAPHDVAGGLGTADGRDALAPRRARLRDDVAGLVAPVARHLAAAAGRVLGRAHGLHQDLGRRHAQAEHQGLVAVVGEEPVVARPEQAGQGQADGLVPGTGDLEEHPALLLHGDLTVVDAAGHARQAEVVDQLVDGIAAERCRFGHGHSSSAQSRPSRMSRTRARNAAA